MISQQELKDREEIKFNDDQENQEENNLEENQECEEEDESSSFENRILYNADVIQNYVDQVLKTNGPTQGNSSSERYSNGDEKDEILDRLVGSIWGQVYGDVAGCPIEGWKSGEIRKFYGDKEFLLFDFGLIVKKGFPSKELMDSKDFSHLQNAKKVVGVKRKESGTELFLRHIRPVGIHSDDTQQGFALINSILEFVKYSKDHENITEFLSYWRKWLYEGFTKGDCKLGDELVAKNSQAFRQFGSNTSRALKKIVNQNKSCYESGSKTTGIGGMMRCCVAPTCFALQKVLGIERRESNNLFEVKQSSEILSRKEKRKLELLEKLNASIESSTTNDKYIDILSNFSYAQCLTTHSTIESSSVTFASNVIAYKFIQDGNSQETIDWILDNLPLIVQKHEKLWLQRSYCPELKKGDRVENQFQIYEPMNQSIHNVSNILEQVFEFIKENRESELLLKNCREKISELAKSVKKKAMKANVNQGFCLLGGIHCLVASVMPENPRIILAAHPSKAYHLKLALPNIPFPELLLYSIISNGYDTDTVAAISGYMLGARFGASSWLLHKSCIVDKERIEKYCDTLVSIYRNSQTSSDVEPVETISEYMNKEKLLSVYCSIQRHTLMDKIVPVFLTNDDVDSTDKPLASKRVEYHSLNSNK
ncbi:predicted protein [Naegleria gruberi]|uniref:Predicted protein n=1 Tax=Naegleria gruberi TaxID=5762 RepID=D2VZX5_NAEGR|nr:uncharacterized protein NAEGRDRAFT_53609 [Naegleria gruberi]EFC37643.1 predicted protein [Naegleria gruberi]|eukprot:XP_002670387.1 predicted protein [Naegleria gruberi strain NEG-M]